MKKVFIFILAIVLVISMTSCGMSWKKFLKDVKSDLGGGLDRVITVKNSLTGEIEWEYTGKAYIDDNSKAGDVTIVYTDRLGNMKKYDALGNFLQITSNEL